MAHIEATKNKQGGAAKKRARSCPPFHPHETENTNSIQSIRGTKMLRFVPTCSGSGTKGCWCWVRPTFATAPLPPPPKTPSRNTVDGTSIVVFSTLKRTGKGRKGEEGKLKNEYQVLHHELGTEKGDTMGLTIDEADVQALNKPTKKNEKKNWPGKQGNQDTPEPNSRSPFQKAKQRRRGDWKQRSQVSVTRQSTQNATIQQYNVQHQAKKKEQKKTKKNPRNSRPNLDGTRRNLGP